MPGDARRSHAALARRRARSVLRFGAAPAAALVLALLATACGAVARGAAHGAHAQEVTLVAQDGMRFTPSTLTVEVGRPVRLVLRNDGALVHDLTLRPGPAGAAKPVRVVAAGKGTGSDTFTPAASGTYAFVCSQAGHEAAGMTGSLNAVAAGAALAAGSPSAAYR